MCIHNISHICIHDITGPNIRQLLYPQPWGCRDCAQYISGLLWTSSRAQFKGLILPHLDWKSSRPKHGWSCFLHGEEALSVLCWWESKSLRQGGRWVWNKCASWAMLVEERQSWDELGDGHAGAWTPNVCLWRNACGTLSNSPISREAESTVHSRAHVPGWHLSSWTRPPLTCPHVHRLTQPLSSYLGWKDSLEEQGHHISLASITGEGPPDSSEPETELVNALLAPLRRL